MKYAPLVGRIMFSAAFLMFGMGHLTDSASMTGMVPSFLPFPGLIVILTGLLLIGTGLAIAVGYKAKLAGLILAVFLLSTAFLVWSPGFAAGDETATLMFMKDLALAGGALLISHFGAGPMSMDAKAGE